MQKKREKHKEVIGADGDGRYFPDMVYPRTSSLCNISFIGMRNPYDIYWDMFSQNAMHFMTYV